MLKSRSVWPALLVFFGLILAGLGPAAAESPGSGRATLAAQTVPTPKPNAPEVGKPSVDPPKVTSKQWVWLQIGLGAAILVVLWFGNVIRPSALGAGSGDGGDRPWWAFLFAASVVYLTLGLGHELMLNQVKSGASWLGGVSANSIKGKAIVQIGQAACGIFAGVALLALASGGLKRPTGKDLLTGVLGIVIALPVVNATGLLALEIYRAVKDTTPPPIGHNTLQTLSDSRGDPWAWAQGATAVVLTPIVEELIYRYFLQTALVRAFNQAWLGVVITSAIFTSAHIGPGAVPDASLSTVLPVLFVLGLALGIAMQRTGKLTVPIVMHGLFNAFNIALTMWR
ncbi:MAG: CPBP family intramembrane glutamic endopeptidase [Phycisphaerales bacterium]|nr:CPBP family intramembrane metalloprotease [Planctomycetota bacterium]